MQGRAILEAAVRAMRRGIVVKPEIMIPLVSTVKEFDNQRAVIENVAQRVLGGMGEKISYLIGTMIELPRAALTAGQIAQSAEFFSFGTNDLTQTTLGLSRDDAGRFLPSYIDLGILADDPFQVLDTEGVGRLVRMAVEDGRRVRPKIKLGICGEHGGEPRSISFCHSLGLDYVSCSPFRVPIARLAAAHAALEA
jgi:pyruvate,orthophosphate dikinase